MSKDDIDNLIADALEEEERELLRRLGGEPGFLSHTMEVFKGPRAWVVKLSMTANIVSFIGFLASVWQMLQADATGAVYWGVSAVSFLILTSYFKSDVARQSESARLLRKLDRLEFLILERTRADRNTRAGKKGNSPS